MSGSKGNVPDRHVKIEKSGYGSDCYIKNCFLLKKIMKFCKMLAIRNQM